MDGTRTEKKEWSHNGERVRPRAQPLRWSCSKSSSSCRPRGMKAREKSGAKATVDPQEQSSLKHCLQASSIFKDETGYGCGGGKTFEG